MNEKPSNCRNRLRNEGKVHPRSGCAHCKTGGLLGCPFERPTPPASQESAGADLILADDNALRYACRVLDGDHPTREDRREARKLLMAMRTRIRHPAPPSAAPVAQEGAADAQHYFPTVTGIMDECAAGPGTYVEAEAYATLRTQLAERDERLLASKIECGRQVASVNRLRLQVRDEIARADEIKQKLAASEARVGRLHNIAARFGGLLWDRYDVCPECGCTKDTHLASCTEAYTRLFKRPTDCAVAFDGAYPALSQSNGGEVGG